MDYVNDRNDWNKRFDNWKQEKGEKKRREEIKKEDNAPSKIVKFIKKEEDKIEQVIVQEVKLHKGIVVGISVVLILLIVGIIVYANYDPSKIRYQYIDIEAKNASGLPMSVYYKSKPLFSLSGWESTLEYQDEKDRLYGNEQYKKIVFDDQGKAYTQITLDNQIRIEPLTTDPAKVTRIGWFANSDEININNNIEKGYKEVPINLENENLNSEIRYILFRKEPYFTADFYSKVENESELGDFGYGFVASGYNIYLPNGTVLINDNNVTKLDKNVDVVITGNATDNAKEALKQKIPSETLSRNAVERKGTSYDIKDIEYEIFYKNGTGFIVFSDFPNNEFEILFQWNVFRIYVASFENGNYSRAYFIILDNANISYDKDKSTWKISDKYFNGDVDDYITKVLGEVQETGK